MRKKAGKWAGAPQSERFTRRWKTNANESPTWATRARGQWSRIAGTWNAEPTLPAYFASIGLGSNVSTCDGPPFMNRKMTRFARGAR
jgi:hypothetical protein